MLGSNQHQQRRLPEYRVVVAYDFGTTYSGAAYAFTHSTPTEVFDIEKWPHKDGKFFPKVPTLSVYQRRNQQQRPQSLRRTALSEWGHGAKKTMLKPHADKQNILLSHIKLHLDESLERPPIENGLTPVQAVADYLSALHQHTLQELTHGFAKNYHQDTFRYCLTVPALWSDKAKHLMRQAAVQAGLISPTDPSDRLVLISEPEAAALYCEATMADQVQFKDNDRIMICDAGGGTVDLIVFQVNFTDDSDQGGNINNNNSATWTRRQLKEVTKGVGESCGSVFLDEHFLGLLRRKMGSRAMDKIYQREKNDLMNQFIDTIKPEFDPMNDYFMSLPRSVDLEDLPESLLDEDEGHLDEGILKFSGHELQEHVYDPVVDKVLLLIEQQYQQIPDERLDFLFLVGGFGSSKYLYERIQQKFQHTQVKNIVCPAERAALAVVRGAAYYGVNPQVIISRISRRTYGINSTDFFDEDLDPQSTRVVKPDGSVRCNTRFAPFVKKNEELTVDDCVEKDYFIYYDTDKSVGINLYATENDIIPRYYDEPGVQRVATISIPIPTMPEMETDEQLWFKVRMYFGATEIRMEADYGTGQKYNVYCEFDAVDNYGPS